MKKLILLALALALGGCSGLPERSATIVLPIERGAPARVVDPKMQITILEVPLKDLVANHRYAGAVEFNGECLIMLPKEAVGDVRATLLAHELRHCAGQDHTVSYNEAGRPIDHWSP